MGGTSREPRRDAASFAPSVRISTTGLRAIKPDIDVCFEVPFCFGICSLLLVLAFLLPSPTLPSTLLVSPFAAAMDSDAIDGSKYARTSSVVDKTVLGPASRTDQRLRRHLAAVTEHNHKAISSMIANEILQTEQSGLLEAEDDVEKTYRFSQTSLKAEVDMTTRRKMELELDLRHYGPYGVCLFGNGRKMCIWGEKGHVGLLDWKQSRLQKEMNLSHSIRDCVFLQDERHFALAERKCVYLYDDHGTELHKLKEMEDPARLVFLPYHFILGSINGKGTLAFQDVSTGKLLCHNKTHLGSTQVMELNPWNGVTCVGHSNGSVTLWAPRPSGTPLLMMNCHRGAISALSVDPNGRFMATSGVDSTFRIWDLRMNKVLHSFYAPKGVVSSMDISHKGLLAVAARNRVEVWSGVFTDPKPHHPYMTHGLPGWRSAFNNEMQPGAVHRLRFVPFEDFLAVGHAHGLSMMAVPGSAEANIDSMRNNPYETAQQRREGLVHGLLQKLQPDMICLNPDFLGSQDARVVAVLESERAEMAHEEEERRLHKRAATHKMKGRNDPSRLHARKQLMRVQKAQKALRSKRLTTKKAKDAAVSRSAAIDGGQAVQPKNSTASAVLARFDTKKRHIP